MTDRQHRRWRERSAVLKAAHAAWLGRALTGRELIDLCDRPAAAGVLGLAGPDSRKVG